MSSPEYYTESQTTRNQSSRGPHTKQWLPQLALTALTTLAIASFTGISLSVVAFSRTDELRQPGHAVAQSFVMFSVSSEAREVNQSEHGLLVG